MIAALTSSFFAGIQDNPAVPPEVSARGQVELTGGVPFVSDPDLRQALEDAGVTGATADAVVEENEQARLDGLRAAMAVLAVIALAALFLTYRIPTRQPGAPAAPPPP